MKRIAIVLALAGMFFWWVRAPQNVLSRMNVLVGTSPVSVWSWDTSNNTFIVLVIPSDYVISGIDGYGKYSLESLWKLGFIDKKEGFLLARSLEQALALRVPFYIGTSTDSLPVTSAVVQFGKSVFSWSAVGRYALHNYRTNVPFGTYSAFSWALARARLDAIRVIDLGEQSVSISEELSDGTKRQVLDTDRLDAVLKGVYEDELFASEGTTVAVYNTTTTPSLGTQAARMLTHFGILVVAVGNASPQAPGCIVSGTSEGLSTKTARLVKTLFDCDVSEHIQQERADITIHLGVANTH